ncbi:MAG: acyl-CoA dehydrogenase family protein [Steroidobacter sp.]
MNLEFSEEQTLLRDSVARFVKSNYSLDKRREIVRSPTGFSPDHWKSMGDLGWLALPFSEADGGLGGTPIETMIVMEQFGAGLVVEPFFASIVLGGSALRHGASRKLKDELLSGVMDGSQQLAFAHSEDQARFDLENVSSVARRDADQFVLNGAKSFVLNAASASHFIVSARTAGEAADARGITLFVVPANSEGLSVQAYPTVDGLRAAELTLKDVRVPASRVLGNVDAGLEILSAVSNAAILALGAEAVGAMDVLFRDTVEYTQQRVQFDHPLSDFQVLQHRMVDMFVEYELTKSLLYRATLEATQASPEAQRSIHALKYQIGKAGSFIGENAVQLHGGMGMTEALRIGHYFKRLVVVDLQFGNADYHLRKLAGL